MISLANVKKLLFYGFVIVSFLFLFSNSFISTSAEPDCNNPGPGDYDYCLQKIQQEIDALKPAHEYNKKELADLKTQLASLDKRISALSSQLLVVERDINQREEDLAFAQEVFEIKTNNHYKFIRLYDPLLPFLSSDASKAFREINFRQKAADEDRRTMEAYAEDLFALKQDKEKLEKNKTNLAAAQRQVDERAKFLEGEVEKVESYLTELSSKQQAIIAARSGSFNISVGSVPVSSISCSGSPGSPKYCNPGFSPAFAGFSFGAWTHRKGMSQWGAKARASNQNAEQILAHYYPGTELNKNYSLPSDIRVEGSGRSCYKQPDGTYNKYYNETVNFDTYMRRIYEVPNDWPMPVLKAQAVAARSYAIKQIQNKGYIGPGQGDQVYKDCNKGGSWDAAVTETATWVLVEGGQPLLAYYSAITGGYLTTSGWDTTDGQGGSNFASKAYESMAGAPWFYASWYTESYTENSAKCNRSNPWLNKDEMADILNAYIVLQNGGDERIVPETINSCPIDGIFGNPYNKDELKNKAAQFETPITSVSGVSDATIGNDGTTQGMTFYTSRGSFWVDGSVFKQAFALRAPGYLAIRSPLFNVVKGN